MSRRPALLTLLAAVTALLMLTPPAHAAGPSDYHSYRYFGSGNLGNWDLLDRTQSTSAQFIAALPGAWVYGDPITRTDWADLTEQLAKAGVPSAVDAQGGLPTAPAVDRLALRVAAHGTPRILIMATGSNDIFNPTLIAGQTRRARAVVGPTTRIIWVNTYVRRTRVTPTTQRFDASNTGRVNAAITYAPGARVVDWYGFLTGKVGRPTAYLSDGVHSTVSGRAARNSLILTAVNAVK